MLKLIKHEIKDTSRIVLPAISILVGMSLLGVLIGFLRGQADLGEVFVQFTLMSLLISVFISYFIFMAVYVLWIFYKRVLSREGYLTLTLPVTGYEIVGVKLIVTLFWGTIAAIVGIALTALIITRFIPLNEFRVLMNDFMSQFISGGLPIARAVFDMVVGGIVNVLLIWFGITLAHTGIVRSRTISAIVFVLLLSYGKKLLQEVVFGSPLEGVMGYSFNSNALSIFNIVLALALFFGIGYLLENKIDLE